MANILIVEDDPDIAMSLAADLRRQGHQPTVVTDGEQAIMSGVRPGWDLILLDVMLPKVDGFDVCAELRRLGVQAPIIMLTARTQDTEKELGLDAGADDYVTKPFSLRELRARIRAQLRRGERFDDRVVRFGDCEADLERGEVRRGKASVDVTAQEWRLLTRDQLITAAWGHGVAITDRTVDTHVFNLRKKLEPEPSAPRWIVGVRGLGYRFEDEP